MPNLNDAPREIMHSASRSMHPMLIVAAGAVTLFCAAGIGVMTGIIPSAMGQKSDAASASTPMTSAAATAAMGNASEAALPEGKGQGLKSVDNSTVGQPLAKSEKAGTAHKREASHPTRLANGTPPASGDRGQPTPVYAQGSKNAADNQPTRVAAYEPPVCRNCGTIDSITPITKQGEGSGAGAVLGGVLGGVIGHQVGNGRGKDLATVAGAVGGAVLGNSVEKNAKTSSAYDVRVRLDDGTFQTLHYEAEPGMRVGDKVKIENGRAVRS